MKISCHTPILKFDGSPIMHPDGSKATFRSIAIDVLSARRPEDNAQDSYNCYLLGAKLSSADFVELSVDDLAMIKKRVGAEKGYNNIVVGRMFDIIEGKPSSPDLKAVKENH